MTPSELTAAIAALERIDQHATARSHERVEHHLDYGDRTIAQLAQLKNLNDTAEPAKLIEAVSAAVAGADPT